MSLLSVPISTLLATSMSNGFILIQSQIYSANGDPDNIELIQVPGESFGGHSFNEWLDVANSTGSVNADWLDV